jgi:protein involved in polysaccharide export with SLBB domain
VSSNSCVAKLSFNLIRRLISAALFSLLVTSMAQAQGILQSSGRDAIGPGDIIRLKIWREPDMSGDFQVASNGRVVLPRLGELEVASWHADSLQKILTDRYKVYLNNPSIEVSLLRRVTITGAVRTPGVYPLDPTMTVADALAMAGGAAPDGKRDRIEIRRDGKSIAADLRTDVVLADSPVQSGDQLYVPTKPWLERNTWVISATLSVAAILIAQLVQ